MAAASLACRKLGQAGRAVLRRSVGSVPEQAAGTAAVDKFNYAEHMAGIHSSGPAFGARRLVPLAGRAQHSVFDKDFVARLMAFKYRNLWKGQVLMKDAVSLSLYTTLLQNLRPGTIFDLGTCGGGSALWFADQARAIGLDARVITVDLQDTRSERCKAEMARAGNIEVVHGNLYDGANLLRRAMESGMQMPKPWLIAEDCHVEADVILDAFKGAGLAVGDYIVFEDTHPAHPDDAGMDALDMANYKCGDFAPAKLENVERAIQAAGDEFALDAGIQDLYGYNGSTFVNSVFVKQR